MGTRRKEVGNVLLAEANLFESRAVSIETTVTRNRKMFTAKERKALTLVVKLMIKATRYLRVVGNVMENE